MPRVLHKDAKEMVSSVLQYFEQEKANGGPTMDITCVRDRVAAALNISFTTVCRIAATVAKGEALKSPSKEKKRSKPILDVEDFEQSAIRNTIYDMFQYKEQITLQKLRDTLRETDVFSGGISSLHKVLCNLGFKYKKEHRKKGLMEQPHIAANRTTFLRQYLNYKKEGKYNFIFLDETSIIKSQTTTKGGRFMILHAGGRSGFVNCAELVHYPDDRGEMSPEIFIHWFRNQLLPNLEKPSVIVLDNASWHRSRLNKMPNAENTKEEIRDWLRSNNIAFEEAMLKTELFTLMRRNRTAPIYEVDSLAEERGHKVLRLPPYHGTFNPFENIWGMCKTYYSTHISRLESNVDVCIRVWMEGLQTITPEIWANSVDLAEEDIQRWYDRDVLMDREGLLPLFVSSEGCSDTEYSEDEGE